MKVERLVFLGLCFICRGTVECVPKLTLSVKGDGEIPVKGLILQSDGQSIPSAMLNSFKDQLKALESKLDQLNKTLKGYYLSLEDEDNLHNGENSITANSWIHADNESGHKRIRFEDRDGRKPDRKFPGVLKERETNEENILNIPKDCCSSDCLKNVDIATIKECREIFYSKTQTDQSCFIAESLIHRDAHKETKQKPKFLLNGGQICDTAWRAIHGVKYRRYQYIRKKLQSTPTTSVLYLKDGKTGMKYPSEAYIHAKRFLEDYATNFGDDQPDCREIHLPSCVTKKCVYDDYSLNCMTKDTKSLKLSRFYEIWTEDFKHVKIRKHQKMTQCAECAVFKEAFLKKLTREEARELEIKRKAHLTLQRICREDYYKHRSKALDEPKKYVSLIIDNMDQSKTNIPRFPFVSKSDSGLTKLHHHVTGVLSHGEKKSYSFTWTDKFTSNCNVTLNCLMLVLLEIAKKNDGSLPPTLYLQADNAAKDNKNQFVLMFLAMLVKAKIVRKIKLSFLMVGHTHEDVDQFFSRISTRANQKAAVTLPDLHNLISTSTEPGPFVTHLNDLWNYRDVSSNAGAKFEKFKEMHVFKFVMTSEGHILLKYKNWPLKSEEYYTEDITDIIPEFPTTYDICAHNTDKFHPVVSRMEGDLSKWVATGRFSEQHRLWWIGYLQQLRTPPRQPDAPLPESFKEYRVPNALPRVLGANVHSMIDRHVSKMTEKTKIKITRKRKQ